jgi:hypothetical protein
MLTQTPFLVPHCKFDKMLIYILQAAQLWWAILSSTLYTEQADVPFLSWDMATFFVLSQYTAIVKL